MLGFFQLLLLAGSETTANLINNAIPLLSAENPDQLSRLRAAPELLPSAIEEVLPLPLAAAMDVSARKTRCPNPRTNHPGWKRRPDNDGSANRDPQQFREPERLISCAIPIHTSPSGTASIFASAPPSRVLNRRSLSPFARLHERYRVGERQTMAAARRRARAWAEPAANPFHSQSEGVRE
jgi:hypothetical protein